MTDESGVNRRAEHEAEAHIRELLDGEQTPENCAKLRAAIAECPECAEHLRLEEEARSLLRRCCASAQHAPVEVRQRIVTSLRIEYRRY